MALNIVKPADEVLREVFLKSEIKGRALQPRYLEFRAARRKGQLSRR